MKKILGLLVALMVMACGNPTEPEQENPYNVQCSVSHTFDGRICNITWDEYSNNDFLAYVVVFEESFSGRMITEEPIMGQGITQCYSFPDVYEFFNPDILYFRIVSEFEILEEVQFNI